MRGKDLGANLLTKIILGTSTDKDFKEYSLNFKDVKHLIDANGDILHQFNVLFELWPASISFGGTNVYGIEATTRGKYNTYFHTQGPSNG